MNVKKNLHENDTIQEKGIKKSHAENSDKDEDVYVSKIQNFKKKLSALVVIIFIVSMGLSVLFGTFDVVPAGSVRIAAEPSGDVKGPISAGWHFGWCNPFAKRYDFPTTVQSVHFAAMHCDTLDGHVNLDLTIKYQIPKNNVIDLFHKYGMNYETGIKSVIQSAFRDEFSQEGMRSVALENRSAIQANCREQIKTEVEEHYFVQFHALLVENIKLPGSFSNAQIQTEIAYEELRAANITRQIEILNATTMAEISQIESEALANATLIEANATAEAIDIIVQELNVTGNLTEDDVLTYLSIQSLEDYAEYGNVLIISDGSTPFIIDVQE